MYKIGIRNLPLRMFEFVQILWSDSWLRVLEHVKQIDVKKNAVGRCKRSYDCVISTQNHELHYSCFKLYHNIKID